ncbi:hypothetical protein L7F22_010755 [Adiantum nelumboides]|nr:hypothetical protein [Adiantum nelumboides]
MGNICHTTVPRLSFAECNKQNRVSHSTSPDNNEHSKRVKRGLGARETFGFNSAEGSEQSRVFGFSCVDDYENHAKRVKRVYGVGGTSGFTSTKRGEQSRVFGDDYGKHSKRLKGDFGAEGTAGLTTAEGKRVKRVYGAGRTSGFTSAKRGEQSRVFGDDYGQHSKRLKGVFGAEGTAVLTTANDYEQHSERGKRVSGVGGTYDFTSVRGSEQSKVSYCSPQISAATFGSFVTDAERQQSKRPHLTTAINDALEMACTLTGVQITSKDYACTA